MAGRRATQADAWTPTEWTDGGGGEGDGGVEIKSRRRTEGEANDKNR